MATAKQNVFDLIRNLAATSLKPLTANSLYKRVDIKKVAKNVEKVSNALGTLYRSGVLKRVRAPVSANSRSKFAYFLGDGSKPTTTANSKTRPALKVANVRAVAKTKSANRTMDRPIGAMNMKKAPRLATVTPVARQSSKPTVRIHQSGEDVVVEMPKMKIVIALY